MHAAGLLVDAQAFAERARESASANAALRSL